MKNPCPFCQTTHGESSAEHWLPDSWEKYFTVPSVMLDTTGVDGERATRRVNNRSPFDLKFEGICKTCNGGWLKDIDEAAKGAVLPFATAQTSRLTLASLDRIALHLTRAALIYTWGRRAQNGYPDQLFRDLYRFRSVPNAVRVFVGNVFEPSLIGGRHSALTLDGEPFAHLVSWTMGRLFALVVLPAAGFEGLSNELAATIVRRSQRKAQLISPVPRGVNLEFKDRVLEWDEARLLGQKHGLMTGEPEPAPPNPPTHFIKRLELLNGDYRSLVKQASAVWPASS